MREKGDERKGMTGERYPRRHKRNRICFPSKFMHGRNIHRT